MAYVNVPTRERAEACVEAWNVIDTIRERHEAEIRAARKDSKTKVALAEKLEAQRRIKTLEQRRNSKRRDTDSYIHSHRRIYSTAESRR